MAHYTSLKTAGGANTKLQIAHFKLSHSRAFFSLDALVLLIVK
jgi:hypothetical protein